MKPLYAITAAVLFTFGFAMAAHAATDVASEVSTAHAHALMAQSAGSVDMAHTHLHHVVNCIVGPEGQAFDAAAGNPCKGMGNGALDDSSGNSALHGKVKSALAHAKQGLNADSLDAIHTHAAEAAAALQATPVQQSSGGYSW